MRNPRRIARPSGMPPPATAVTVTGETVQLVPLAEEVTRRHLDGHPEDVSRYGEELAWQWCVHDMQHVLAWAITDQEFRGQLAWLARILDARDYPVNNLFDCVLTAADVLEGGLPPDVGAEVAGRMREVSDALRYDGFA
jgi:hypothetical protein